MREGKGHTGSKLFFPAGKKRMVGKPSDCTTNVLRPSAQSVCHLVELCWAAVTHSGKRSKHRRAVPLSLLKFRFILTEGKEMTPTLARGWSFADPSIFTTDKDSIPRNFFPSFLYIGSKAWQ